MRKKILFVTMILLAAVLLSGLGTAFTAVGQIRFGYDAATNLTTIQANTDADAQAEIEIVLIGQVPLVGGDFIL